MGRSPSPFPPPAVRIHIAREATDLLGTEALAQALGVARRSLAYWKDDSSGTRTIPDGALHEMLPLIDAHIERARQLRRTVFAEICAAATKDRADGQG